MLSNLLFIIKLNSCFFYFIFLIVAKGVTEVAQKKNTGFCKLAPLCSQPCYCNIGGDSENVETTLKKKEKKNGPDKFS